MHLEDDRHTHYRALLLIDCVSVADNWRQLQMACFADSDKSPYLKVWYRAPNNPRMRTICFYANIANRAKQVDYHIHQ